MITIKPVVRLHFLSRLEQAEPYVFAPHGGSITYMGIKPDM